MAKNYLSPILIMASYVLSLITLSLAYLEFQILFPICYLFIRFIYKTMHFATLMLIGFLYKIYKIYF